MSTLNYTTATYYRHSGRVPSRGLLLTLFMGVPAAILVGAIYAYVDLYIPIAGYITFLITAGTGFLLGWVLSKAMRIGKVRNTPVASLLTFAVGCVMYVATWVFYLYAAEHRYGDGTTPLLAYLLHPGETLDFIMLINAQGLWSFRGSTPTGIFLDIIWALEAALLLGVPIWFVRSSINELPFCENCDKWCVERPIVRLNPGDAKTVRTQLESRDFAALGTLGLAPVIAGAYWNVTLQGCGDCDTTQTLCIESVTTTTDSKGKTSTTKSSVIKRLVLTPEDTVAVATVAAMVAAPPAAPAQPLAAEKLADIPPTA